MAVTLNASNSGTGGLSVTSDATGALAFQTAGTTAVTVDTSQKVGIGTTSPSSSAGINKVLQVSDATSAGLALTQTGGSVNFELYSNGSYGVLGTTSSNALLFTTGNTERMRIDTSGNVGIGTTSPSYRVDAVGTGTASTGIIRTSSNFTNSTTKYGYYTVGHYTNATAPFGFIQGESNSTDNLVHIGGGASEVTAATRIDFYTAANNTTTSGTERARFDSSGSFMIGTTSPGGRLTVAGSDSTSSNNALYVKNANNTALFYVRDDGWTNLGNASLSCYNNTTGSGANMYIATDQSIQRSTSSLKYKTDVVDARFGLADVLKLRAVNYKSKNPSDGDKVFGGLIAEEVEEAGLTEFVQYAEDGTPDALSYGNMVAMAFKAIQEQQAVITAQAETITALTARIVALEK